MSELRASCAHSPAHQLLQPGFPARLVCWLELCFPAVVCAAWPVAAGRVGELGSSPAAGMPPSVTSSMRWGRQRGEERVPAHGSPPHLLRRARQGTGIPGARLALPYLQRRAQPHRCYRRPWRTSWCYTVSLNRHKQSFGCSLFQYICGGNNTLWVMVCGRAAVLMPEHMLICNVLEFWKGPEIDTLFCSKLILTSPLDAEKTKM